MFMGSRVSIVIFEIITNETARKTKILKFVFLSGNIIYFFCAR